MNYYQVHRALEKLHGPARSHTCGCGEPAKDWAYLHTAGANELVEDGLPYSNDPKDYKPMCRRCHNLLDGHLTRSGVRLAQMQKDRLNDPVFLQMKAEVAQKMTLERQARSAADPSFRESLRASSVRGARTVAGTRRRCLECGMVSHQVGLGKHQKVRGHVGWVVVP